MLARIPTFPRLEPQAHDLRDRREVLLYRAALVAAVALGVVVRGYHVLRHDFPLNDGGLFYTMVRDLQGNGYRIPGFTSFNTGEIPFGYPPLAMYVAGFADDLTPLSLMTLFRLLPLLATAGTVVAFAFLARDLLRSRVAVVSAVVVFGLTPRSFIWPLMGGGLTRSFGLLFAILALWAVHRMYARRDRRYLLPALLLATATVLSHVETGWFLAFSIGIFWLTFGRYRASILPSATLAAGTLILTAPWWATVMSHHGLDPFLAAQQSGGSVVSDGGIRIYVGLSLARVVASSEPWYPLLGTLGLFGAFVTLALRRYYLVGWWLAVIVLDPRAFPTLATLPVSLLAGIAVAEVLIPILRRFVERPGVGPPSVDGGNGHHGALPAEFVQLATSPASAVLGVLLVFAVVGALVTKPGLAGEGNYLKPLSSGERDAMAWIAERTDPEARILVVPHGTWETDKEGEWFPVLTQRVSVATVQGFEWISGDGYRDRQDLYWDAYECGFRTTACLDQWVRDYPQAEFTHVYIPRFEGVQCCSTLTRSLNQDSRFTRIYEDDGGTIWERKPWVHPERIDLLVPQPGP